MLHGRFGATTNSPYFEARISIPKLNVSGHVSFLLDTGADTTTLMPADGVRLGLPWDDLSKGNPMPATGIGGQTEVFVAPASVTFRTEDELYGYSVPVCIVPKAPDRMHMPSLLGRDIVNQWRLAYDNPGNVLTAEIISADFRRDILRKG